MAEAACTHAIGALSYTGSDDSVMSQPAVCGGNAALASKAGACVAAALEELSCSGSCAAALTALPGVCGGMVPRRGGLRESRECSHALTAAQRTCSAGDNDDDNDASRCTGLLSAVPPVEVRQHAAALAREGGFGETMLASIDWSQTSLAGVLGAADACAMRSMHLDVSFNDLTGELPACLLNGTAATKSALLGGNRFHSTEVPKIGEHLHTVSVAFNDIGGDVSAAVTGGRPKLVSLHVGGNSRMSGDFAEVLASAPNLEFIDIADTAITAADDASAAAAISAAAALTHYHVGGAAFVPVLGAAQRGGRGDAAVHQVEAGAYTRPLLSST